MFRTIRIIKLIFLYFPKKKRGEKKINKNEIFSQANLFRKIPIRPNSERNRAEAKLPAVIFHGRSWIVSNGSRKASNRVLLAERCVFAGFSRRLARNERHLASAQKFFRSSVRKPRAFRGNPICVCSSVSRFRIRVSKKNSRAFSKRFR